MTRQRLLEIESLLLGIAVMGIGGIVLKWTGLPAPLVHAIAFFAGMLAMFPGLDSIAQRRGQPLTFPKYAAVFFGSAVLLMSLHGLKW